MTFTPGYFPAPKNTHRKPKAIKPAKVVRKIKPKPRSAEDFARVFGSEERVEFVKSLRCIVPGCPAKSENAHTASGGKGRKADADTIAPICRHHHRAELHVWGAKTFEEVYGVDLRQAAADCQAAWQKFSPTPPTEQPSLISPTETTE